MLWILCLVVFFFKQKTAYEMRISDWSSDVCSSDLRKLAPNHRKLVAAPEYLAKWGAPARPEEINDHALITLQPGSPINDWHFFVDDHETMIRARGTICTNHGDSILALALSDAGLAMLAAHGVGEQLKSGRQVSVLDDHCRAALPIHAGPPLNRPPAPKGR